LANDPKRAAAHNNLANMLKAKGQLETAIEHYREARQLQPEAVLLHGQLRARSVGGRPDRRGERRSSKRRPRLTRRQLQGATAPWLGLHQGRSRRPRPWRRWRPPRRSTPKDFALQFSLGLAYGKQGHEDAYRQAVTAYQHALKLKPADADTLNNLGWNYLQLNDLANAEENFKAAVAAAPEMVLAYNNLGVLYDRKHDQEQAAAAWAKVVELNANHADGWVRLGEAKFALEDWPGAAAALNKAIELGADHAEVRNKIGLIHEKNGEYEQAEAAFRKAIAIDAAYAIAYNNLGVALEKLNKVDEAKAMYAKALELDPEYEHAKFNLSRLDGNG